MEEWQWANGNGECWSDSRRERGWYGESISSVSVMELSAQARPMLDGAGGIEKMTTRGETHVPEELEYLLRHNCACVGRVSLGLAPCGLAMSVLRSSPV